MECFLEECSEPELGAGHPHEYRRCLEDEREDVGETPDIVWEQRIPSRHVVFPDKESNEEEDGDDERGDEDGGIPAVGGGLGEAEDEEDEASDQEEDADNVHPFEFGGAREIFGRGFCLGHEEPCEDREWGDDDGYYKN